MRIFALVTVVSGLLMNSSLFADSPKGILKCQAYDRSNGFEETMSFSSAAASLVETSRYKDENGVILREDTTYVIQSKSVCGIPRNIVSDCIPREQIEANIYNYSLQCLGQSTIEINARKTNDEWHVDRYCESVPTRWYRSHVQYDGCTFTTH